MSCRNGALSVGAFFGCLQLIVASVLAAPVSVPPKFDSSPHGDAHLDLKELPLMLVQAHARVQARTPNPEPPRMYVAEGCDGSTATMAHAREILALHGIEMGVYFWEALEPHNNRFYPQTNDIMKAMKMLNEQVRGNNKTLVFKSILHRDMKATTSKELLDMGTMAVYVTRKNPLDQMVCMIRDCFFNVDAQTTPYGYPVDSNGKESNLCFERRTDKNKDDKAMLKVIKVCPSHNRSLLGENLAKMESLVSSGYEEVKKAGYTGPRIWYEDIMAFEKGGNKNVETSLELWEKLLKAWGVTMSKNDVRKYLVSKGNTWSQKRQQAEIHNYDEVKAELINLGREDVLRD